MGMGKKLRKWEETEESEDCWQTPLAETEQLMLDTSRVQLRSVDETPLSRALNCD